MMGRYLDRVVRKLTGNISETTLNFCCGKSSTCIIVAFSVLRMEKEVGGVLRASQQSKCFGVPQEEVGRNVFLFFCHSLNSY